MINLLMQQKLGQPSLQEQLQPFIILHNYRHRKTSHDSLHKSRRIPHDYTLDRKSIILTRKMKAELQQKSNVNNREQSDQMENQVEEQIIERSQHSSQFFNENELEKGIPLNESEDRDILYNRIQMTWTSNYSKLQKALFGMSFAEVQKKQDQQQMNIGYF